MAAMLAFGRGSSAASCARMSPTARSSSGLRSDTRMPFSVRVPVLSAQTTSTRARPSMAGSSLTRHCRWPSRITPTANAIDVIKHQTLGHHRHQRTDHPQHRFPPSRVGGEQLRVDDQQAGRDQQVGDELQDLVDAAAQFGIHQRELAGLFGELGGVGFPADLGGPVRAAARDDEAARHHLVAGVLRDRVGLAGEQGLVDLEVGVLDDLAVDDDLVAGPQFDDVVEHDLVGRHRAAVPDCLRTMGFAWPTMASLSSVCLARSSWMMPIALLAMISSPNSAVDHRTGGQHDDQQHAQDRVDAGEHVGPDDVGHAARRAGRHVVRLAVGDALGDFGVGEPGGDERGHRRSPRERPLA